MPNKKKRNAEKNEEAVMGVVDHIREFRNRLFVIVIVFFIAMLICLKYASTIVDVLQIPSSGLYAFIYISPQELFYQYIKVSLIGGLVVAAPVIIYELLAFASPGLKMTERTFIKIILALGLIFFVLGVLFAYEILLPFMLRFFITINNNSGIEAQVSIEKYLSLCLSILSMMGIVFEMPVLTILLTQLGFLKPEWLRKSRRVVIVACFVLGAIITPPDVVSQVMVAIPMMGLFEISILFCTIVRKRKDKARERKQEEAEKYTYQ